MNEADKVRVKKGGPKKREKTAFTVVRTTHGKGNKKSTKKKTSESRHMIFEG